MKARYLNPKERKNIYEENQKKIKDQIDQYKAAIKATAICDVFEYLTEEKILDADHATNIMIKYLIEKVGVDKERLKEIFNGVVEENAQS